MIRNLSRGLALALTLMLLSAITAFGQEIEFAHDVLPLLQSRCAECHTNGQYKGGLSLETRDDLLDSGAVEIGSHLDSDLYLRLISDDPDYQMPPEGDRLTAEQIKKVATWIDQGLNWPEELTLRQPTFSRPLELRTVELPPGSDQHPIDRLLAGYLRSNNVQLPPPLTGPAFYRRAKLDLLGLLPTAEELDDVSRSKSLDPTAIVDQLLSRDRDYADHWLTFWNDLLRNDYVGTGYIDGGRSQITRWLHRSLRDNKPYDQFVRELIDPAPESEGFIKGIKWRGRVNASQIRELQFSQNISQVFLGINMKCASCHDSFIDDWKLVDAYGLAAVIADQPLEIHRCDVSTGEVARSKFVFPELGTIDDSMSKQQRLDRLAQLMTDRNNGRFARTIVNRLWHRLMGRGLVHPVDVMANEAWSEPLLDFLASDLVANHYDLKQTLRLIATSGIYRRQTVVEAEGPTPGVPFVFRGPRARRMTAEQFVDAVWQLTGTAPRERQAEIDIDDQWDLDQVEMPARWIWDSIDNAKQSPANEQLTFRRSLDLKQVPTLARAIASCDNRFVAFVNGKKIGQGNDWMVPTPLDLKPHLKPGRNEIIVRAFNGGDAPNPAAFFFQGVLVSGSGDEANPTTECIVSDRDWSWTRKKVNPQQPEQVKDWQPAVELGDLSQVYGVAKPAFQRAMARLTESDQFPVRASLVVSDALMRSLGRPNREQVVTTRPEELSTLQAIDLSNGKILDDWIKQGARRWLDRKQASGWSESQLVNQLFIESLSRAPTTGEVEWLLSSSLPEAQTSEQEFIEDLIWTVLMLPEFQIIQ